MYRFLLTPGWVGRIAAALVLAAVMSLLGVWQLDRYEQRAEINARIDTAADSSVPLESVLTAPAASDPVGPAPAEEAPWTVVTASGRFDPDHEVLIRGRSVEGRVGYVVLTPLVLADGVAVLVARGWVPPAETGAGDRPDVPAAPDGTVKVTARVRPSESGSGTTQQVDGVPQTRRIHLPDLGAELPYSIYGGYLQLEAQDPPPDPDLTLLPVRRENTWMNAGYAAQWWIFAGLVLGGTGWWIRREAHRPPADQEPAPAAGTER